VTPVAAQRGKLDPAFENIAFDQWLAELDQAHFHFTVKVPRAELSFHQRLVSSIDIKIDGRDLQDRRDHGNLLLLIQLTDSSGAHYQDHGDLDLSKLDPNVKDATLTYSQHAFLVPGDYELAVALLDSQKRDHSISLTKIRIAPPSQDFLVNAWSDLPAVEYIGNDVSPESWYLPYIDGRLRWAGATHSPAQVNVILNLAPSTAPGSRRAPSSGLAALLPSLKVLTQTGSSSISERTVLLDMSRRKTVFDQNAVHELDWPRLKTSLSDANTASIDIHSLENGQDDAQFFVSEVRRVLRASADKPCVLVVLTQPVAFESKEDREPISTEALPPCHVFYLRFHRPSQIPRSIDPMSGRGRHSRMGGGPMMGYPPMNEAFDQLASTLKPLNPKVIDVEAPDQVTKALAEILKAIIK